MDEQDIRKIENAFQIKLPHDYTAILLDYPSEINDARDLHLSDSMDWVIGQNEYVRENPANFYGKETWLSHHFIIGEDGDGNCFYLNLQKPLPSPIFFLDHAEPNLHDREVASSFDKWIPKVRQELDEHQRNAELLRENMERRKAKRPWWQFW